VEGVPHGVAAGFEVAGVLQVVHVDRICFPDRRKSIALRSPCFAQAQGNQSLVTRRTHAFNPWRLRAKLSALLLSCSAQKAGDLPILANPASRMRRALFCTVRKTNIAPLWGRATGLLLVIESLFAMPTRPTKNLSRCRFRYLLVHSIHQSEHHQTDSHHDIAKPIKMRQRAVRPLNDEPARD
jgi:hypothetical protein